MLDHAIVQFKLLQDRFGISCQRLQLVVGVFGQGQFHQLDFFKLMLAVDSPRVAAVAAGLRTEAGRVGCELQRQHGSIEYLFPTIVCYWNFAGGNQIKATLVRELEKILFELWQLGRTEESRCVDDIGRQRLLVSVLSCLHVEHEVDERPAQTRTGAIQDCEPRARNLCSALKIKNS